MCESSYFNSEHQIHHCSILKMIPPFNYKLYIYKHTSWLGLCYNWFLVIKRVINWWLGICYNWFLVKSFISRMINWLGLYYNWYLVIIIVIKYKIIWYTILPVFRKTKTTTSKAKKAATTATETTASYQTRKC